MAKSDESLVSRLQGCTRTLSFATGRMKDQLSKLEQLERYLPKDETVIALFRLHINSLQHELKYLGEIEDDY